MIYKTMLIEELGLELFRKTSPVGFVSFLCKDFFVPINLPAT